MIGQSKCEGAMKEGRRGGKSFIQYYNLEVNGLNIGTIAESIYKLVEHRCP